jgi:hypothetical protein
MKMIPDRVRAVLDRRRSNAAGPHKTKRRDDEWLLVELEELVEVFESGDLKHHREGLQ